MSTGACFAAMLVSERVALSDLKRSDSRPHPPVTTSPRPRPQRRRCPVMMISNRASQHDMRHRAPHVFAQADQSDRQNWLPYRPVPQATRCVPVQYLMHIGDGSARQSGGLSNALPQSHGRSLLSALGPLQSAAVSRSRPEAPRRASSRPSRRTVAPAFRQAITIHLVVAILCRGVGDRGRRIQRGVRQVWCLKKNGPRCRIVCPSRACARSCGYQKMAGEG